MHYSAGHSQWQSCIPEILSETFLFRGPLKWPYHIASPILQVCSSWRKAALSTPQLWTSVDYCIDDLKNSSADSLECWLLRRGRSEIHLDISLRSDTAERNLKRDQDQMRHIERLRRFESFILARAYAWRRLILSDLPNTMVHILQPTLLLKATRLEYLSVSLACGEQTRSAAGTGTTLVHLPNLKTLKMEQIFINLMPRLRASHATTLHFDDCHCTTTEFMELMKNMPAIRVLTFDGEEPYGVTEGSLEKIEYICPSLTSLTFRFNNAISPKFFETLCCGAPLLVDLYMNKSALDLELNAQASNVTFSFLCIVNSCSDDDDASPSSNWGYIVNQSKKLFNLQTVFCEIAEFPAAFPSSLQHLELELILEASPDFNSFELEFITTTLESLSQLETLTLIWRRHPLDGDEISFTPFLQALTRRSQCGSYICPCLHSLELYFLPIDESVLIEATQIHTELIDDLRSSIKDSGSKDNDIKFTVTLEGCILLPEIKDASHEELKNALERPHRIVPPYNGEMCRRG